MLTSSSGRSSVEDSARCRKKGVAHRSEIHSAMSKRLWARSPKGVEQAELTSPLHQKLSMVFDPEPPFVMIFLEEPKTTTAERLLQAICCV
jgi:hypothetical protein